MNAEELINTREGMLRLAAFVVMMQHGEGVMAKAPIYIEEKFLQCMQSPEEFLEQGMDDENTQLFRVWKRRWEGYI